MAATNRDDLVLALTREWTRLGAELVLLSQSVADRLKINITDLQVLAVVVSAGPITAGQIAEAAGLTTGAITGVVDRLEKAGLVLREDDPADRRRVVVRAVPGDVIAARDPAVGAALAGLATAAAEQYEGYSDRELQLVVDALARAHPVLLEHVTALRQQAPARHELEAPLSGAQVGRLVLAPGVGGVTLAADAAMPELYRAQVEGTAPIIEVQDGTVTVRARRTPLFGWGHRSLGLTLNAAIPWDVEVNQGAVGLTANLQALQLRSFTVQGGASRLDINVGMPAGAVPISIRGGASRVTIRRPRGVPVEVRIRGGVSRISIDGKSMGSAGGNIQWRVPDTPAAASGDHYRIEVLGGVSRLTIEPS